MHFGDIAPGAQHGAYRLEVKTHSPPLDFGDSAHLPPAIDMNDRMFEIISAAPTFIGPDQQVLESMLAAFEP
ncbi:hypothetical protein [Nocardia anaemiae]|uniref:hypothetical protein n=1 Tax=Nocardia anaemiae TaxID=263910 RepID=UPI0007A46768|nr:hypothetical protein [Nocardia anaemiae]